MPIRTLGSTHAPLRRRDTKGLTVLPSLMATPPTITLSAAGGSTAITGSTLIPAWDTSAFIYSGTVPAFGGTSFPGQDYLTANGAGTVTGVYPSGKTSSMPWTTEFWFNSSDGLFEIALSGKGTTNGVRVVVNDQYATLGSTFAPTADGSSYLGLVNLGSAGAYRIRLEFAGGAWFGGVRTLAANAVTAIPRRAQRWIVLGDSFTEPTVTDSGSWHAYDGWVQQLGLMLGVDAWSAGAGGTGYLNPGSGRVKFRDRIGDVTANNPDVVVVAGGINDYSLYTASAIGTEAAALFAAIKTALPNADLIVLSPFWPRGFQGYATNLLATADAIETAALAAGATFIDVLRLPPPPNGASGSATTPATTTLTANAAVSATSIQTAALLPLNTYIEIGSGTTNAEVRRVTSTSGTGPYTLNFGGGVPSGGGGNLGTAKTLGNTVTVVGQGIITGSGKQGTTTGDGTADRFIGSDATHPTREGHRQIAISVYRLLMRQMAA